MAEKIFFYATRGEGITRTFQSSREGQMAVFESREDLVKNNAENELPEDSYDINSGTAEEVLRVAAIFPVEAT